jgi:glycosyltransferase
MKVSVIIPVFNGERTIEKALFSVSAQTYPNIELIVVDGGSTDGTVKIIQSCGVKVDRLISEKDEGYADALNKGVAVATGDYVIMLAADDYLLPKTVERFAQSVRDGTELWCGADIGRYGCDYYTNFSSPELERLRFECSLRNPASFFRRDAYTRYGGYDASYRIAADREIMLRFYLNHARIQVEKIPIVVFSQQGMSNTAWRRALEGDWKISVRYGLSGEEADKHRKERVRYHKRLARKLAIKQILLRSGMIQILHKALKRNSAGISAGDLIALGIPESETEKRGHFGGQRPP